MRIKLALATALVTAAGVVSAQSTPTDLDAMLSSGTTLADNCGSSGVCPAVTADIAAAAVCRVFSNAPVMGAFAVTTHTTSAGKNYYLVSKNNNSNKATLSADMFGYSRFQVVGTISGIGNDSGVSANSPGQLSGIIGFKSVTNVTEVSNAAPTGGTVGTSTEKVGYTTNTGAATGTAPVWSGSSTQHVNMDSLLISAGTNGFASIKGIPRVTLTATCL